MKRSNEGDPDRLLSATGGSFHALDPEDVVERRYDLPEAGSVTETVVYALAEAVDADPTDLTPLEASVDTEALDRLFRPDVRDTLLSFEHDGHSVTVSGEGRVVVAPTR